MHCSFNLNNFLFNDNFRHHSFHNLRNLDDFLNNSRNNDDFFNDFLDLDDLWYFNHLFNHFFNWNLNFLDSVNVPDNLHNLFLDVFYGFGHIDVVVDDLFNFDGFWFLHNDGVSQVDLLDDGVLYLLDNWLLDNFLHLDNPFVDDGDFDDFLDFHRNLLDAFDNSFFWDFDSLDSILVDDFLFHCGNFPDFRFNDFGGNYFFDNLGNLNDFLYHLHNWDGLFDDPVNNLMSNFDVVFHFLCIYD